MENTIIEMKNSLGSLGNRFVMGEERNSKRKDIINRNGQL